jgi:hypothetical protein
VLFSEVVSVCDPMCPFVRQSACVSMAVTVPNQGGSLSKDSSLVEQRVEPHQDFSKTAILISLKGKVAGNHTRWPSPVSTNRLERPNIPLGGITVGESRMYLSGPD